MISITISNGVPYVWDAQDWLLLRKEHRITGVLDGPVGTGLSGRLRWNLPMRLSQVEVQYLVSRGIVQTVHAPNLAHDNPPINAPIFNQVIQQRKDEQLEQFKRKRREEIVAYLDKMLEGKRRKGKIGEITDKEAFIQGELDKITKMPYEMYQLDLKDPWKEEYLPYNFPIPTTYQEKLKFRVFEDFHLHKKYWLSSGAKFGGDFLAYPGDPRHFHAEFIIMCLEQKIKLNDCMVSQSRLAMTVKKTLLIATIDEHTDNLMYYVPKGFKS